jgi:4-hydroxybenzoate polyprenyltransferase
LVTGLLASLRPKQWTKNLLVFAGFLFTIEQKHPPYTWLQVLAAFGLFCALSGAGYIVNDALDCERDRQHPRKCKRPIASGRVPVRLAVAFAVALAAAALAASFLLDFYFGLLALAYLILTSSYTFVLKHVVIVDVLAVTAGFVIRAVAGAVVVSAVGPDGLPHRVEISPWLLVCTTLLALFLASAKRRAELSLANSSKHRQTLDEYSAGLLDQMINIAASACLMGYLLYTFTPASKTGTTHPHMMITIPFVVYGLFRYLYLIHTKNLGGSPEQLLIDDKPLLVNILLYVVAVVVAFKW